MGMRGLRLLACGVLALLVLVPTLALAGSPQRSMLANLPTRERTKTLGGIVNSAAYACRPTSSMHLGDGTSPDASYYSVTCDNGHSYGVQIMNDEAGSTKVLDCVVFRSLGLNCFKTF